MKNSDETPMSSTHNKPTESSQHYLKPAILVSIVLLLIAAYFAFTSRQTTTELSDAELAVEGARAQFIEEALKNYPQATYANSNCAFNALNERYMLTGLFSLQDKIDSGEATESEIQELNATVAHCYE